jgi:hypothetical protein
MIGTPQCGHMGAGSPCNTVHVSSICSQFVAGQWYREYSLSLGWSNFPQLFWDVLIIAASRTTMAAILVLSRVYRWLEVWLLSFTYIYTEATEPSLIDQWFPTCGPQCIIRWSAAAFIYQIKIIMGFWHCDIMYKLVVGDLYVVGKVVLGCKKVGP